MAKGPSFRFCTFSEGDEGVVLADLKLAKAAADLHGLKLPAGFLTSAVYERVAASEEWGHLDFSSVFAYLSAQLHTSSSDV